MGEGTIHKFETWKAYFLKLHDEEIIIKNYKYLLVIAMTILYIKACGMQVMQYIKGDI